MTILIATEQGCYTKYPSNPIPTLTPSSHTIPVALMTIAMEVVPVSPKHADLDRPSQRRWAATEVM